MATDSLQVATLRSRMATDSLQMATLCLRMATDWHNLDTNSPNLDTNPIFLSRSPKKAIQNASEVTDVDLFCMR